MSSRRLDRVNELLKHEIGEIIRREFNIADAGLISVNSVEVSPDLRTAKAFISVLGNPDQQKRALRLVRDKRQLIQGEIGRNIVLKYTPTITFLMDESIEHGNRILKILDEIEQAEKPKPNP